MLSYFYKDRMMRPSLRPIINKKLYAVPTYRKSGFSAKEDYIQNAKLSLNKSHCSVKQILYTILGIQVFDEDLNASTSILMQNRFSSSFFPPAKKIFTASTAELVFHLFVQCHAQGQSFVEFQETTPLLSEAAPPQTKHINLLAFRQWVSSLIRDEFDVQHLLSELEPYANRFYFYPALKRDLLVQNDFMPNPHLFILNLVETSDMSPQILEKIRTIQESHTLREDHHEILEPLLSEKCAENQRARTNLKVEKSGLRKLMKKHWP